MCLCLVYHKAIKDLVILEREELGDPLIIQSSLQRPPPSSLVLSTYLAAAAANSSSLLLGEPLYTRLLTATVAPYLPVAIKPPL